MSTPVNAPVDPVTLADAEVLLAQPRGFCAGVDRARCRVEYFIFGLFSEMRFSQRGDETGGSASGTEVPPLPLFAVGSDGAPKQFKAVEFLGGDRGDMPSQGRFTFAADRLHVAQLEASMISAFGHAAIHNAAAACTARDGPRCC